MAELKNRPARRCKRSTSIWGDRSEYLPKVNITDETHRTLATNWQNSPARNTSKPVLQPAPIGTSRRSMSIVHTGGKAEENDVICRLRSILNANGNIQEENIDLRAQLLQKEKNVILAYQRLFTLQMKYAEIKESLKRKDDRIEQLKTIVQHVKENALGMDLMPFDNGKYLIVCNTKYCIDTRIIF
jgi:hypothetical protein